jgi:sporulation protein YlmC with PRC-barrel domain
MRLNELLGQRVVDAQGKQIGGVADVRLVQDGPLQSSMQSALRVDGLVVVEKHATQLMGYERHVGPALLRWLVHRRLGDVWYLPWKDIERISDGVVRTRGGRAGLVPLDERPRH